jgi:hypothetical protein
MNPINRNSQRLVVVFTACLCGPAACGQGVVKSPTYPARVLIIRHAEKPNDVLSVHLSEDGKKRAEALSKLFETSDDRPEPFPKPDIILAASDTKNSHRPSETVAPLAKALGLTVDTVLASDDPDGAAKHLFFTPKYSGKVILVSWRHTRLPDLARRLGAADTPKEWKDGVFDRVWDLTFDEQGKVTFRNRSMQLMPGDAKK